MNDARQDDAKERPRVRRHPRKEYDQLRKKAVEADLPPYPKADAKGNYPAFEYLRVSIARDIIRDRLAVGLTQVELAKRRRCARRNTLPDRNGQAYGEYRYNRQA